jgi:hypothetical protein
MKTYLFSLGHPAHFHMFKHTIRALQEAGHKVIVVIRPKDVLEQLCINEGLEYQKAGVRPDKGGKLARAAVVVQRTLEIARIVKKEKPCMLIGSDGVMAYLGTLFHIPSFEFFDDDYDIIKLYAWVFFPFYSDLVCPNVTNAGRWSKKKTGYEGYQKLSYLHPNVFTPDKSVVEKYFSADKPYFLLRFAKLNAHHDGGIGGINTSVGQHLIDMLLPHGDVYITSERPLEPQFEKYRLHINPSDMHHVMAFASLYIGDSQSMAVEAAMLGTPSLRFNDFAGKISVLEELEHKYQLTFAIPPSAPDKLYSKVTELLTNSYLSRTFQERRQKMLAEKIDVSAFFTWFISNYPESRRIMRENPDYQWQFK